MARLVTGKLFVILGQILVMHAKLGDLNRMPENSFI